MYVSLDVHCAIEKRHLEPYSHQWIKNEKRNEMECKKKRLIVCSNYVVYASIVCTNIPGLVQILSFSFLFHSPLVYSYYV